MRRLSIAAVAISACVALVAAGLWVAARFTDLTVPFLSDTCRAYGQDRVVRLQPGQLANAATISAVGVRYGVGEHGIRVALATAFQESKLHNLRGGDRDSVGLFQQRPSQGWGTVDELMSPRYASAKFYEALLRVPGWEQMRLTDAAQAVQRSAHPEHYQKWEGDATALASALFGEQTGAVTCKLRQDGGLTGAEAASIAHDEFELDYQGPEVVTGRAGENPTLTVSLGGPGGAQQQRGTPEGWRMAHWFVAKSREYGIRRVEYAGTVWTASSGKWSEDIDARTDRVYAHVAA